MRPGVLLAATACFLIGCSSHGPQTPVQRGRVIYMTHCAVCHNLNPNLPGSLGPAVAGSSRALLEARVLHLTYPPGYKPKRETHKMRAFPQLGPEIGDLTAFLQSAKTEDVTGDRKGVGDKND